MKKLILLRGPSGSGKSTIANTIGGKVFETDQFWTQGGIYSFDPAKLGAAHKWNQENVASACGLGFDRIVVANTSMTRWEMKPYLDMAKKHGYTVEVLRTPGPWDPDVLFDRNVHGVPLATLQKQINKYQPHNGEIEWTDMSVFQA